RNPGGRPCPVIRRALPISKVIFGAAGPRQPGASGRRRSCHIAPAVAVPCNGGSPDGGLRTETGRRITDGGRGRRTPDRADSADGTFVAPRRGPPRPPPGPAGRDPTGTAPTPAGGRSRAGTAAGPDERSDPAGSGPGGLAGPGRTGRNRVGADSRSRDR